jgi:hypothetical protein
MHSKVTVKRLPTYNKNCKPAYLGVRLSILCLVSLLLLKSSTALRRPKIKLGNLVPSFNLKAISRLELRPDILTDSLITARLGRKSINGLVEYKSILQRKFLNNNGRGKKEVIGFFGSRDAVECSTPFCSLINSDQVLKQIIFPSSTAKNTFIAPKYILVSDAEPDAFETFVSAIGSWKSTGIVTKRVNGLRTRFHKFKKMIGKQC